MELLKEKERIDRVKCERNCTNYMIEAGQPGTIRDYDLGEGEVG